MDNFDAFIKFCSFQLFKMIFANHSDMPTSKLIQRKLLDDEEKTCKRRSVNWLITKLPENIVG